MSEINFPTYKGRPLVRKGSELFYGSMADQFVVMLQIKSTKQMGELKVADKVAIKLMCTDPALPPNKQIIKSSEKNGLFTAIDFADVWLTRALNNKF